MSAMHKFIPKEAGNYFANQSYWMYVGKNPMDNILWHLGFWDYTRMDGHSPEQRDHNL